MNFQRLRLSGFKSFVDPADLVIDPGITGVVGPNGCGKSNLIEALRWVMGESSARRVRGSEMDDIIFAGTDGRPARNVADVTLVLENPEVQENKNGDAGEPFRADAVIEIKRRIERGAGSDYRINGRSTRARDVQLLFKDLGTGAASPSMVSQGRVAGLIDARPVDRRILIEDAAGVTGLRARRREAELRLLAAEENLLRLDDILLALEDQQAGLKRQARQAERYRTLSGDIRDTEARIIALRRRTAMAQRAAAAAERATALNGVADATQAHAKAEAARERAAEEVPPARRMEAETGARLQRLTLAREALSTEFDRLAEARRAIEGRIAELDGDLAREVELARDGSASQRRLQDELTGLATAERGADADRAALVEAAAVADAALRVADRDADAQRTTLAGLHADKTTTLMALGRAEAEVKSGEGRLTAARAELDAIDITAATDAAAATHAALEAAETATEQAEEAAKGAQGRARDAGGTRDQAAAALGEVDGRRRRLQAEAEGLAASLDRQQPAGHQGPALADLVEVPAGLERAVAAALGAGAALGTALPDGCGWLELPALTGAPPPWPDGITPLADRVGAPSALARRIGATGLADSEAAARAAQPVLAPGRIVVTAAGRAWHWTGLITDGDTDQAAARLDARNRLAALRREVDTLTPAFEAAGAAFEQTERRLAECVELARTTDLATGPLRATERAARAAAAAAANRLTQQRAEAGRRQADHDRFSTELDGARAEQSKLTEAARSLPDSQAAAARAADLEARRAVCRREAADRHLELDRFDAAAASRQDARARLENDLARWQTRLEGGEGRLQDITRRLKEANGTQESLAARPAELERQAADLADRIAGATAARRDAADRLATAETALRAGEQALAAARAALAACRERRAGGEVEFQASSERVAAIETEIDRLPTETAARLAGLGEADIAGDEDADLRATLERQGRARDAIGPVNLRAALEAEEAAARIEALAAERADLVAAIERLRRGISTLNREARDRLLTAFEQVDRHFRDLFRRFFGGGQAYLKLLAADDPLEAGLEIYASPPGKKLQHLSLLSGGEQALTALSVLFAVFVTNPAPICVLDEVDAPLDDANVDRFCTVLSELAESGETRFVVITHHRMTMARVHRLFGVTMAERGVSQLVSVDLEQAEKLPEAAV